MKNKTVLEIKDLNKVYRLYRTPGDRLWQLFFREKITLYKEFRALENVSFALKKGESLGILGRNGSGKSTLLQMLAGTLKPTSGEVNISGRVSALLDIGSGFHGYFTGRENVYMKSAVAGLSKYQIDQSMDKIEEFADIGGFFDRPVKIYSSGMLARLAFAVAVNVDPDIFLVDETLAVGDIRFRTKCYRKFEELMDRGKTIVLVSHSSGDLMKVCDNVIWLEKGKMRRCGPVKRIIEEYQAFMRDRDLRISGRFTNVKNSHLSDSGEMSIRIPSDTLITGDGGCVISAAGFFDSFGKPVKTLCREEKVSLKLRLRSAKAIQNPRIGFEISDAKGMCVLSSDNAVSGKPIDVLHEDSCLDVTFSFSFPEIDNGIYFISAEISSGVSEDRLRHCRVLDIYEFYFASEDVCQRQAGLLKVRDCSFDAERVDAPEQTGSEVRVFE